MLCVYVPGGATHKTLGWGSPYPHDHSPSEWAFSFLISFHFFLWDWNDSVSYSAGNKNILCSDDSAVAATPARPSIRAMLTSGHRKCLSKTFLWSREAHEFDSIWLLLSPVTSWPVSHAHDWRAALNRQEQITRPQMQQRIWCAEKRSRWEEGPKALTKIATNKQQQ